MTIRRFLFWTHLVVGVVMGLVILSMCVTGTILAFEPQLTDRAEQPFQTVIQPTPDARPLDVNVLLAKIQDARPESHPTYVMWKPGPQASVVVGLERKGILFVNPYTGEVIGQGSKTRVLLHKIEEWHRWLGNKKIGGPVTGAAAIAFLGMAMSGLYLWWPKQTLWFKKAQGKARDWNWHNVIGFWCSFYILLVTTTGILLSYNLLPRAKKESGETKNVLSLTDLVKQAQEREPGWTSVMLRLPSKPGAAPAVFVKPSPPPENLVQRLRFSLVPLHTGRIWGWPGQMLNFIVALGGIVLIWTGFALAWRRFVRRT